MTMKTMFRLATGCIAAALLLAGCGGGGTTASAAKVTGTASEGALITNAAVKLKDATGKLATGTATTDANGSYSIDVTGLTAPYLVTVTGANGTYVSLAPAAGPANINPITTTVVALAVGTSDPATLFTNLKAADVATISANYAAKADAVTTALAAALPSGVKAADYFTGTVEAGKGMDSVFDSYKITVNPGTGITVTTKDASATTVLAAPTITTTTVLPPITKPSIISLTADKSSMVAGQSITITADVKIAGNAAPDNTVVTFTTDAGTLSATTAKTSGGKASVTITASAVMSANVSASVSAAVLQAPVKVSFTTAPTYAITLTPDVTTQVAGKSITIIANVTLGGTAAADGTSIAFTTAGGQLSATTATTTNGKATVTLTAGAAGSATVTASAGAGTPNAGTSAPLALTFTAAPTPVVTLTSDKSTAVAGQNITLTATVTLGGAAVADGTSVTFATNGGTLSASSATTVNGKASVTITAGSAGSANVTATSGGKTSNAVALTFTAPVVYTQAILKLKTVGTLPSGKLVGGWQATIKMPATGISIKTKSSTNMALDATAFYKSGVTPAGFTFTGSYNKPDASSTVPYVMVSNVGDLTDPLAGTALGEVATLVFDIAAGTPTPQKTDFVLTGVAIAEAAIGAPALNGVTFDFDISYQ